MGHIFQILPSNLLELMGEMLVQFLIRLMEVLGLD